MQLLRLTLQLPRCLTTTDNEGDLPCTLVRIAPSTLTKTAAHMLASAIEKEEEEAAAQRLRGVMHGDEEDEQADSGVFVLPLPPAHEQEAISQLFVFGQVRRRAAGLGGTT